MIKKLILSTACGLLLSGMVMNAQSRHELSVLGGGGLSTFNYSTTTGSEKLGMGGHVGIGYGFFFNDNIGILTGAELTFYNSKYNGDFSNSFLTAYGNDEFLYTATVNGYEERQHGMFINIPLMFQYQTNGRNKFYASLGGKFGIPVSTKFETRNAVLQARGYFEHESMYLGETDHHNFLGLGDFQIGKEKKDLNMKLAFMLSAEAGMKWNLKSNIALYTGVYADYGLNNIMKDNNQTFIAYNQQQPENFQVNSILTSQYNKGAEVSSFTDKVCPLAVGIKIKVSFGLGHRYKEYIADEYPYVGGLNGVQNQSKEQDLAAIKDLLDKYRAEDQERYQDMLDKMAEKEAIAEETKVDLDNGRKNLTQTVDNYEVGVVTLSNTQRAALDEKIAIMKKNPSWKIIAVGHTCDVGATMVNKNVGQERADATMEYMVRNGISRERIISVSRGMSEPVVPNTTEENRRKNRRVEFLVTEY